MILTGHGDTFITHYDIPEMVAGVERAPGPLPYRLAQGLAAVASLAQRNRRMDAALRATIARDLITPARVSRTFARMARDSTVYIAAINGIALGMGCIVALNCDLRLMADGFRVGLPEATLGFIAGAGGTQKLVRDGRTMAGRLHLRSRIWGTVELSTRRSARRPAGCCRFVSAAGPPGRAPAVVACGQYALGVAGNPARRG